MKLRSFLISIAGLAALSASAFGLNINNFAKSSRLASGNWVKFGIDQTGVYEISYETLRNMGFSNPEKVGVYGNGGIQLNYNFVSAGGNQIYFDDLQQVPVFHYNGKLYFYGNGTTRVQLYTTSSSTSQYYNSGGYFSKKSKNIYSNSGYYFLSDSQEPLYMTAPSTEDPTGVREVSSGLSYVMHEVDLLQNDTQTGRLFFGEKIDIDNPRMSWQTSLQGAIPNAQGAMECHFYIDRGVEGTFSYGVDGAPERTDIVLKDAATTYYKVKEPTISAITIPGVNASPFISLEVSQSTSVSNLDFWVLSYQRSIPTLIDNNGERLAQDFIAFPKITAKKDDKGSFFRIPGGASYKVFDISTPTAPKKVETRVDGADAIADIIYSDNRPQYCIFDPLLPQLQIKGFETGFTKITNQNLHEKARQGADLIIICTPKLKESAERLADIHRSRENLKVIVASADEVYNEFSYGLPDPMAYRALVKMAYSSDYSCKNLLLLGPLYADFRGIVNEKNADEGLIAYQSYPTNQLRGAMNNNSFYGIMSDYLSSDATLESAKVNVGVGILPLRYPAEAETYIDKVEKYIDRTDFAYYLNTYTNVGGVGDDHTHDKQAIDIGKYINGLDYGSGIMSTIVIDSYGFQNAHNKFIESLNNGRLIANYFGHGSALMLNKEGNFFFASDVFKMRNSYHPFLGFAGCEITNSDRGERGIGETIVYSTPYGALGTLVATRQTWSGQNMSLFKTFYKHMHVQYSNNTAKLYRNSVTLGEIFASTLTESTFENEMAYQLICDPAIVLPTANRPLYVNELPVVTDEEISSLDAPAGNFLEFTGYVPSFDDTSKPDTNFNGEIVARLMEPVKSIECAELCSDQSENTKKINVPYTDLQIAMSSAIVENGQFKIKMFVPGTARDFDSQFGRLHLAAYCPASKMGAGTRFAVKYLNASSAGSPEIEDTTPPVIESISYNALTGELLVKVSDNVALDFSSDPFHNPFRLFIDGIESAEAAIVKPVNISDGSSYEKNIPLTDLADGSHSAKVQVADAAGNIANAELIFTQNPEAMKYAIRLEEGAVRDSATIRAISDFPANADIVILSAEGSLIRRESFKEGHFTWDACDMQGARVAKGLYKAYIIETGKNTDKGHSATIDIPVI